MSTIKIKNVYVITEGGEGKNNRWHQIGVCFENKKDGSFNVILDALPVNGKLHIRDREEKKETSK